jgi:uncharacterized RDD family membrane protein YckC
LSRAFKTPEFTLTANSTPESICSGYDFSIVALRWAGALIDLVVIAAIFLLPDLLLGNERYQLFLPLWSFIAAAYFPVTEGLTGRSLGKFITRIIVVDEHGRKPGLWKAILRTLTRLVEVNPFLFGAIPAGVTVLVSKKKQRLGDMLAHTYVLKRKDLLSLSKLYSNTLS